MSDKNPNVLALEPGNEYNIEITGFGDIYEKLSVLRLRRRLAAKFGKGDLYLAPNSSHGGLGETLGSLEAFVESRGLRVVSKGYVDSPPWRSNPRPEGTKNKMMDSALLVLAGTTIIRVILLVEFLFMGEESSHMVYCYTTDRGGDAG